MPARWSKLSACHAGIPVGIGPRAETVRNASGAHRSVIEIRGNVARCRAAECPHCRVKISSAPHAARCDAMKYPGNDAGGASRQEQIAGSRHGELKRSSPSHAARWRPFRIAGNDAVAASPCLAPRLGGMADLAAPPPDSVFAIASCAVPPDQERRRRCGSCKATNSRRGK